MMSQIDLTKVDNDRAEVMVLPGRLAFTLLGLVIAI